MNVMGEAMDHGDHATPPVVTVRRDPGCFGIFPVFSLVTF